MDPIETKNTPYTSNPLSARFLSLSPSFFYERSRIKILFLFALEFIILFPGSSSPSLLFPFRHSLVPFYTMYVYASSFA